MSDPTPAVVQGHSTISVRTDTKTRIKRMKRSKETWDDLLNRLADSEDSQ